MLEFTYDELYYRRLAFQDGFELWVLDRGNINSNKYIVINKFKRFWYFYDNYDEAFNSYHNYLRS